MTAIFQQTELEAIATYWRIFRRDGFAIGFTSHDRDLVFDGLRHKAAPGMVPSAIRRSATLESEILEVEGVLSHDGICARDLAAGRFDLAQVTIGVCNWETLSRAALFTGSLGSVGTTGERFEAELRSGKDAFLKDLVPRTSPTCRAEFCDDKCQVNSAAFTLLAAVSSIARDRGAITFDSPIPAQRFMHGFVRWLDGPMAGIRTQIADVEETAFILDTSLDDALAPGHRAFLREGCDHTLATCQTRFDNALNFRGEPFLPGNDLLARYPTSAN